MFQRFPWEKSPVEPGILQRSLRANALASQASQRVLGGLLHLLGDFNRFGWIKEF